MYHFDEAYYYFLIINTIAHLLLSQKSVMIDKCLNNSAVVSCSLHTYVLMQSTVRLPAHQPE